MSFFKDFKEDLSQAVNELLPEEKPQEVQTAVEEQPQMVDTITEEEPVFGKDDIADMLKNIDSAPEISTSFTSEPVEDEVQIPQTAAAEIKVEPVIAEPTFVTPEPVAEPLVEEPIMKSEPVTAPVMKSEPVTAPVMEAETEPVREPEMTVRMQSSAAETEKTAAEEPVMTETVHTPVTPIFAQETKKHAPINTTMEDFTMETGIIIAGMSVKGNISSEGSLDVQGNVTGNIDIKGKLQITGTIEGNSKAEEVFADGAKIAGEIHSNGSVKIGQSSVVRGNISAKSAVLAGAVKGDIDVDGPVVLDTTAIIMGNIKSKSIQINNGAVVEGLCSQCYADVSPISFFDDEKAAEAEEKEAE